MPRCKLCGGSETVVSSALGICLPCVRSRPEETSEYVDKAHAEARAAFELPPRVPRVEGGVGCKVCANQCSIPEGELGYCGMRTSEGGRLVHKAGVPARGLCEPYYDPLPTNCVAAWTCPGSREWSKRNLAVFYLGCSRDCLYCQNWSCRMTVRGSRGRRMTSHELASMVDDRTACVCYFGGDPGPHSPHALRASDIVIKERPGVRICWETNGAWAPRPRERMIETSLASGGIIKVDLKAWNDSLYRALTGHPIAPTIGTIEAVAARAGERPDVPLLVVSTLLVPGYVDAEEVGRIAEFLAGLDPPPPYSLLAFHPDFEMRDIPPTSRKEAKAAKRAAVSAGLEEVHIGNIHILW